MKADGARIVLKVSGVILGIMGVFFLAVGAMSISGRTLTDILSAKNNPFLVEVFVLLAGNGRMPLISGAVYCVCAVLCFRASLDDEYGSSAWNGSLILFALTAFNGFSMVRSTGGNGPEIVCLFVFLGFCLLINTAANKIRIEFNRP